MIMSTENKSEIVIFKTSDEKVSIDVRFEGETVWLRIDDMASLFEKSREKNRKFRFFYQAD